MKYLISCLIALPLITACHVVEDEYYPPVPGAQLENHEHHHYSQRNQHSHEDYGYHSRNRVYHDHNETYGNAAVVIKPQTPARVEAQKNVHIHDEAAEEIHNRNSISTKKRKFHAHS